MFFEIISFNMLNVSVFDFGQGNEKWAILLSTYLSCMSDPFGFALLQHMIFYKLYNFWLYFSKHNCSSAESVSSIVRSYGSNLEVQLMQLNHCDEVLHNYINTLSRQ